MHLVTLGTGSKGNCYELYHDGYSLLLDCGVPMMDIYKGFSFNLSKIDGCLLSHSHIDHCSSVKDIMRNFIPVLMSKETAKNLLIDESSIVSKSNVDLTRWCVNTFKLEHDSDNTGFLIQHKETKQIIMYATDSGFIRTAPLGVNILIIECNFMESLVKTEEMEDRFKRVFSTHMSLERLLSYLSKIDKSVMHKIILVHLSDRNSHEATMISEVEKTTGIKTFAAHNGETIDLNPCPF